MKIFRIVTLIIVLFLCVVVMWYGCRPDPPPPPTPTEVTDEPTSTEVPPTVSPTETEVYTETPTPTATATYTATFTSVPPDDKTPEPLPPTKTLTPYEQEFDRCLCHQDVEFCLCSKYNTDNHP